MTAYKLIYKQIQPVHIGRGRYGILGETRIFIPGWTIWGAITRAYNLNNNFPLSENQDLFERITNFYPVLGNISLFPKYEKGSFYLGNYKEQDFRSEFCNVFMSTAVSPLSRQAQDTSLHELEFILPIGKSKYNQIFWTGIVLIENNFDSSIFPKHIFVGGDVRYGFGLMELVNCLKIEEPSEWQLDINGDFIDNYQSSLLHFLQWSENIEAEGELELIPEFNFFMNSDNSNYKINTENTGYFYTPGTKFWGKKKKKYKLYKGKLILS